MTLISQVGSLPWTGSRPGRTPCYAGATALTVLAGEARLRLVAPEGSAAERGLVGAGPS